MRHIKTEALANLLQGMPLQADPRKTTRDAYHYEFLIGIGDDHTAQILIDHDAYDILMDPATGEL
jgi:hypothetical protein